MSGPAFFQTRMGQIFFEGHVPALIKALDRIADSLSAVSGAAVKSIVDGNRWECVCGLRGKPEEGFYRCDIKGKPTDDLNEDRFMCESCCRIYDGKGRLA